jgi:hypothetical protein
MSVCENSSTAILTPLESNSSEEAMAAAKKARSGDVQSFVDIQIEDLKLKDTGKKQKDSEDSLVVLPLESFNLTPSGWLSTKYGFDLNNKYGKPSFLGGEKTDKASESLSMRIVLDEETTAFFKRLDEHVSEEYQKLRKVQWQPIVTEDKLFGTSSSVKVFVVLAGNSLTKLTVVADEKVDRGEGWDFLKDYLDKMVNFYNAEVKVCVRPRSIWHIDGKAGLSLAATRLVLRAHAKVENDPFGDDAELLA